LRVGPDFVEAPTRRRRERLIPEEPPVIEAFAVDELI